MKDFLSFMYFFVTNKDDSKKKHNIFKINVALMIRNIHIHTKEYNIPNNFFHDFVGYPLLWEEDFIFHFRYNSTW